MPVVAAPAVVVSALLALAFLLAWRQWQQSITTTLSTSIPVIGNLIASGVDYAGAVAYASIVFIFDSMVAPVANAILSPIFVIESTVASAITVAQQTYNAFWWTRNVYIPAAISTANAFTQATANALLADAQQLYNQSVAFTQATAGALLADAQQLYNQSVAFTQATASELLADAQSLYNQGIAFTQATAGELLGDMQSLYNQSVAFTRQAYDAATAYATAIGVAAASDLAHATTQLEGYADATATHAVGVLATDIDNAISGTLSGIWTDVDGAVTDVVGVIGTGDAAIRDALGRIDWTIPANIAGVASLLGVTTLTLTRYLRDCGIPNCQNLGQFGQDLNQLGTLLSAGAFMGLIAELIHNPSAAHEIYDDTLGPVVDTGMSAARSLLSV